jgi:hypothetical protein
MHLTESILPSKFWNNFKIEKNTHEIKPSITNLLLYQIYVNIF